MYFEQGSTIVIIQNSLKNEKINFKYFFKLFKHNRHMLCLWGEVVIFWERRKRSGVKVCNVVFLISFFVRFLLLLKIAIFCNCWGIVGEMEKEGHFINWLFR